jgi:hypothetical protein
MSSAELISTVVEALLPVLLAALSFASVQTTLWLRQKIKHDQARGAAERLSDVVYTVVSDLAQTTAGKLKEASADGKLSAEDAKMLLNSAVDRTFDLLGDVFAVRKALSLDERQLALLIESKVEEAIGFTKPYPTARRLSAG